MQDMGAVDGFDELTLKQKTVVTLVHGILRYNQHVQTELKVDEKTGDASMTIYSSDYKDIIESVMEMVKLAKLDGKVTVYRKTINIMK